ncbi:hypothetical protein ACFLZM_07740 [Thermodesulfobacteriota bacterium]
MKILEYMDSQLFDFYETTEVFEKYTSTEGMSGSKKLAAAETPPTLELEDGYSVQIEEERWGGAIELLEGEYRREANDATMKVDAALKRKRNKLLVNNTHVFLTEIFKMLNEAFDSTSDYLAPDSVELCGTHSWATTGADTFDNGVTTALDTDGTAVDTAVEFGSDFKDAAGVPMPQDYDTIIVKKGSANSRVAKKLFAFGISPISVADINIYQGEYKIIETPYITTTNKAYWFMQASMNPDGNSCKVGIGEFPTLREPIKQNNEAIRTNCTGFYKLGICNMPFDWYGSDGTT